MDEAEDSQELVLNSSVLSDIIRIFFQGLNDRYVCSKQLFKALNIKYF